MSDRPDWLFCRHIVFEDYISKEFKENYGAVVIHVGSVMCRECFLELTHGEKSAPEVFGDAVPMMTGFFYEYINDIEAASQWFINKNFKNYKRNCLRVVETKVDTDPQLKLFD